MSQAPSQAGKFKPTKPQPKKGGASIIPGASSGHTSTTVTNSSHVTNSSSTSNPSNQHSGRHASGRGQGRGGRNQGAGRFVAPRGQVFFTGSAAQSNLDTRGKSTGISPAGGGSAISTSNNIIIPGSSKNPLKAIDPFASRSGHDSLKSSSMHRSNEGEEIIVGSVNEGEGVGDRVGVEKETRYLDRVRRDGDSNALDMDDLGAKEAKSDSFLYTYDSDSSGDEETHNTKLKSDAYNKSRSRHRESHGDLPFQFQPQQLPCKSRVATEEAETHDTGADPPLKSPFLSSASATVGSGSAERGSWIMFKFPTRLPRLDPHSTVSGSVLKYSSKTAHPDVVGSMSYQENVDMGENNAYTGIGGEMDETLEFTGTDDVVLPDSINSTNLSQPHTYSIFDDTLKETASGRYGKIVVYKSGKAYLVIGGGDHGSPTVRLALTEGLSCNFLQHAVSIDTDKGMYIPLGEVKKSVIVSPDIN